MGYSVSGPDRPVCTGALEMSDFMSAKGASAMTFTDDGSAKTAEMGQVCQHGSLARQCLICELEYERYYWKTKAEMLAEALRNIRYETTDGLKNPTYAAILAKHALADYESEVWFR